MPIEPLRFSLRALLQCFATAALLILVATLGVVGSRSTNVHAAPGQPDILPTRPDNPTNYPTIAALLEQSPQDTVVVLHHVMEGERIHRASSTRQRYESLARFLEYVDFKRIRTVAFAPILPGESRVLPQHDLPEDLKAKFRDTKPELIGIESPRAFPLEMIFSKVGPDGKTLMERSFAGVRNIVLITGLTDSAAHVPAFEAVWNRVNVYRNVNLDARRDESADMTYRMRFVDRLDANGHKNSLPLKLPKLLGLDPHLHYTPIGQIFGVLPTLPDARYENGSFAPNGTPLPHIIEDGAKPRDSLGPLAPVQQYDAQYHLMLQDENEVYVQKEIAVNRHRSGYTLFPVDKRKEFARLTLGKTDADLLRAIDTMGVGAASKSEPYGDPTIGRAALASGVFEMNVDAHGAHEQGTYLVGDMTSDQLAAVIAGHPNLDVRAVRESGATPRIAHLRMAVCGMRCDAAYKPGEAPGLGNDETGYAQALVRALRRHGVAVDRVTVHNATLGVYGAHEQERADVWFRLKDVHNVTRGWAYESRLLTTTMAYHPESDTFVEDPDYASGGAVTVTERTQLPLATHADQLRESTAEGVVPDSIVRGATATASPGIAHLASFGGVLDVDPTVGLKPRLEFTTATTNDWSAMRSVAGSPGTVVTMADLTAIMAATRSEPGQIVVVDTDPARLAGISQAVYWAGKSDTVVDWAKHLKRTQLAPNDNAHLDFWGPLMVGDSPAEPLQDSGVVRAWEALRDRAHYGGFEFVGADLASPEGAAAVNARLGQDRVAMLWLMSDDQFLARGALLGSTLSRGEFLHQLRTNIALLMGPETVTFQMQNNGVGLTWKGEEAYRTAQKLAGGAPARDASTPSSGSVTSEQRDSAALIEMDEDLAAIGASDEERRSMLEAAAGHDQGTAHGWWSRVRETLGAVADWLRARFTEFMRAVGLWDRPAAQTPAQAAAAHESDPVVQNIEAQGLVEDLLRESQIALQEIGRDPHDFVPLFHTVEAVGTPCTFSGCESQPAEREYTMKWLHESTGEELETRTRATVFHDVRRFVEKNVTAPQFEGAEGHVGTLNAAFAIMGMAHILEANKRTQGGELPDNLATGLQVQMYLGEVQAGVGLIEEGGKLVGMARELIGSVRTTIQASSIEGRLLTTLGSVGGKALSATGGLLSGAAVGLDAWNLANAQTATERAVAATQLTTDSIFMGLMLTSYILDGIGLAAEASVVGNLVYPLIGVAIGVAALVETFSRIAQNVDDTAKKFDKYANLYPRQAWTVLERHELRTKPPGTQFPWMNRRPYHFIDETRTLQPVPGVAFDEINLADIDAEGYRFASFAESYIDRANLSLIGTPSIDEERKSIFGGNHPQSDPNAPPMPMFSRLNLDIVGLLPMPVGTNPETLVLPTTPASRFHDYDYGWLPFSETRYDEDPTMMGYTVLRKFEHWTLDQDFFLFGYYFNGQHNYMTTITESWLPTPVTVKLDGTLRTVAWPEFVIPKDTKWTPEQQAEYRSENARMRSMMSYRFDPLAGRTEPYLLALQDGYGSTDLRAPAANDKVTTWVLDARNLQNPDDVTVWMGNRPEGAGRAGYLRISGLTISAAGVTDDTTESGEGRGAVYVVMKHGLWHVDFSAGKLVSKDLLAATDLVHERNVKQALLRKNFAFTSDGFIEIEGTEGQFPVQGDKVQRYYQSVRDENLVYAAYGYPKATLLFGDEREALFHDVESGLLLRVANGSTRPTRTYALGPGTTEAPHTIQRVDRAGGADFFVIVEYPRLTPATLVGAAYADADASPGASVAYRVGLDALEVTALFNHNRLSAHLEESDARAMAIPDVVDMRYGATVAGALTPISATNAEWITVAGRLRIDGKTVVRQAWIRSADGLVVKPMALQAQGAQSVGQTATGARLRSATAAAGQTVVSPGDLTLLTPADAEQLRFYSPSLGSLYTLPLSTVVAGTPVTRLEAFGPSGALPQASDADGLRWSYTGTGKQLIGIDERWVLAHANTWLADAVALVKAQPSANPAASPLPVSLRDPDGNAVNAWYVAQADRWILGAANLRVVDDGMHAPWRATLADADRALWESTTVSTEVFAQLLDGAKLRKKVVAKQIAAPQGAGQPVTLTARHDIACEGTLATFDNASVVCQPADGGKPKVLELAWCPNDGAPALPAGTQSDYVQLTCSTTPGAPAPDRTRTGWLSPKGERIAAPKPGALTNADDYRVLGFNAQRREAYFFHPGHALLYVTNWSGELLRRHWMADANIVGDALYLRLSRDGLQGTMLPLIDGLSTLGLASASAYATDYVITADTWDHYTRIVADVGNAPIGPHDTHEVQLMFTQASKLEVHGWPGGWRAWNPDTGQTLELRGRGGNKTLHFGDTGKTLDLTTVPPVTFAELPKDFVAPPEHMQLQDRLDVDGDHVADLVWMYNAPGEASHIRWMPRRADGSLASSTFVESAAPIAFGLAESRFLMRNGRAYYCVFLLVERGAVKRGATCHAIGRDGVRQVAHSPWTPPAGPLVNPADLEARFEATMAASRYWRVTRGVPYSASATTSAITRYTGVDFECVREAAGNGCLVADALDVVVADQPVTTCKAATQAAEGREPAWCTRARQQLHAGTIGDWVRFGSVSVRANQGDVECMSYDGRNCVWSSSLPDYTRAKPLTCGAPHRIQWNDPGYGNPQHWCEMRRDALGLLPPAPPPAGAPATPRDLAIAGTPRVGATLTAQYRFDHPRGAGEAASRYQWFITDASGVSRPINGAKSRSVVLGREHQGARTVRFTIEQLVATTGDISGPFHVDRAMTIEGRPPGIRNLRIEGEGKIGATLRAKYDISDADGDALQPVRHQWCEYRADSDVLNGCTAWNTSDAWVVLPQNAGKRLSVRVEATTATGTPASTQAESAKTSIKSETPPTIANVRITGAKRVGELLHGAYDYQDNDGDLEDTGPQGTQVQWYRRQFDGTLYAIPGATGRTYRLRTEDRGQPTFHFRVTTVRALSGQHREVARPTAPADAWEASWRDVVDDTAPTYLFHGNDLAIPEYGNWVESTFEVADRRPIEKLVLRYRVVHTHIGDLLVELRTPWGETWRVHDNTGGSQDNIDAVLQLAQARGRDPNGRWTLRLRDMFPGDAGHLDQWSLRFEFDDEIADGTYAIRVKRRNDSGVDADLGCMIASTGNQAEVPSLFAWNAGAPACGMPAGTTKGLWEVQRITASNGATGHLIRNRTSNRCLMRGGWGNGEFAELYLGTAGDPKWCGFTSADHAILSGLVIWDLGKLARIADAPGAYHAGPISVWKYAAPLTFSPVTATPTTPDVSKAFFGATSGEASRWTLEFHPRAP